MTKKAGSIVANAIPIVVMIGLIPFVKNDWLLALIFAIIIAICLVIKMEKHDITILIFGLVIMTMAELFFVKMTVEFFIRDSLFNLIPVWLPLLWGYAFVAIKRSVLVISEQ